jgi:tRNA pseudouridine55 synthase
MPFLLINKPAGITSHDVVDHVRKATGERTVGHAGTLDPFATGLLIVGVGRESTKHLNDFLGMDKTYRATILIGKDSTTLDPEGEITDAGPGEITSEAITAAIKGLTGDVQQIPPMHSAIKIGGKKLYELARKGVEIDRPPRAVTVKRFEIASSDVHRPTACALPFSLPVIIDCTSGTYIRALARDLGEALGTKAYLTALERTAIGPYQLADAAPLATVTKETWHGLAKPLTA